jgi:hypothetical protein
MWFNRTQQKQKNSKVHRTLASRMVIGIFKNRFLRLGMVAYVYNPRFAGGRDQEDCSLRPAQERY